MSYYFCIIGSRDNPIYQADLASKPVSDRSGPSSFFSSSSSTATTSNSSTTNPSSTDTSTTSTKSNLPHRKSTDSSINDVFGFGSALTSISASLNRRDTLNSRDSGGRDRESETKTNANANPQGKGLGFGRYNDKHVLQMIAHSSLDTVEDVMFINGAMYLKSIDRINEWSTSAFVLPGNIKFLILHEHKHDDGIRNFFLEVWESWLKISLNPFHDINAPIRSVNFDTRVRTIARKHL